MGKVRTRQIKRIAKELLSQFPDKFSLDFEANKKAIMELTNITSQKLRNQIAGYICKLIAFRTAMAESEAEE